MYNFYKTSIDNEKSLKESLFNILKFIKKLLKKLTIFIITFDLLNEIKKRYERDNIVQRIIIIKVANLLKIFYNLIKKRK